MVAFKTEKGTNEKASSVLPTKRGKVRILSPIVLPLEDVSKTSILFPRISVSPFWTGNDREHGMLRDPVLQSHPTVIRHMHVAPLEFGCPII